MGLELADLGTQMSQNRFKDIREQQDKEAGVVEQAVQIFNAIEAMRRGSAMQAQGQQMAGQDMLTKQGLGAAGAVNAKRAAHSANLAMASEFLGAPTQTQTENTSGRGLQNSQGERWGTSFNCCWTFMEAYEGRPLPEFVRRGRDQFVTESRRDGYRIMSSFLVPRMRASRNWRQLVRAVLVRPFEIHGEHFYTTKRSFVGWALKPYCWTWILAWQLVGKVSKWLRF